MRKKIQEFIDVINDMEERGVREISTVNVLGYLNAMLDESKVGTSKLYSGYTKDCKKFVKYVEKVNGKITMIRRNFKDGSGIEYEKRSCGYCGLRYNGKKNKIKFAYNATVTFSCYACGRVS